MAKIIIPTSDLEAWELLSPTDKLDIARWSHVSKEILEAGLRSNDPNLVKVCKQRLLTDDVSPARRFQPVADLSGDAIEINEPLSNEESRLVARRRFRDQFTRPVEVSSEAEMGMPIIIQHPLPSVPADLRRETKQSTFPEFREMKHAIADAPTKRNWSIDNLFGIIYNSPRNTEIELSIDHRSYHPLETATQALMESLSKQALVTISIAVRQLIDAGGHSNVSFPLQEMAGLAYGLEAINTASKAKEARARVYNELEFCSRIIVRHQRKGKYRINGEGLKIDAQTVSTDEALFKIAATTQRTSDPSDYLEVILEPRGLLKAFARNKAILQEFGSLNITTNIQPGRPPGMIARSLYQTLVQIWREEAARHEIGDNGDDHRETIRYRPFTRRELLISNRAFRGGFDVADCLDGKDAKRIVKYWESAIKILKKDGAIGHYLEKGEINLKSRYWRDLWLDQKIEIRPAGDAVKDAIKIAQVAEKNRKALKRAKAQKARKTRKATHSNQP